MRDAAKTLKVLRQNAPRQDRNVPPLLPSEKPHWASARDGSRYVAISLFPRTLDELRRMGRSFGEAAVAEARWGAVTTWMMKDSPPALRNPYAVVQTAVILVQEHDRHRFGWPCWQGKEAERATPALLGLSPVCQREAMLTAAETRADWEAAGSPWLDAIRLKPIFQYLVSSPAFISKYITPDNPAINSQDKS